MEQVDFGFIGDEDGTIFNGCFEWLGQIIIRMKEENSRVFTRMDECSSIIDQMEKVFFFLIDEAQNRGFNTDEILENPDSLGRTCFSQAAMLSEKIARYILKRDINVSTINVNMDIPRFQFPALSLPMMDKGINPYIIADDGKSSIQRYPSNFKSQEQKKMLSKFSRSIHYSVEHDIECSQICEPDCPSKFRRFFYKNGPLVEMTDENRIGEGGFGMVYKLQFHGKEMAAKCVCMNDVEFVEIFHEAKSNFQNDIMEYTAQQSASGSGILNPIAVLRQQDQEHNIRFSPSFLVIIFLPEIRNFLENSRY